MKNGWTDILGDGALVFHHESGTVLNLDAKPRGGAYGPTSTEKANATITNATEVAFWGSDNAWPQRVVEEIRTSDLLRPLIRKLAKRQIGAGLRYGHVEIKENGDEVRRAMQVPEIDRWLRRTNHKLFELEAWNDLITQGNVFAEFQMDYDNKVAGVFCQDACRARLARKDDYGRIKHCYLSGSWPDGARHDDKKTLRIVALDPYYDVPGQLQKGTQGRYILPIRLLVDDADYYGQGVWHGLIEGGYLDLLKAILKTKLYLTLNLSLFRYQLEVGSEWWELAYPGWKDKPVEEKKKLRDDLRKSFAKWVQDQTAQGRVLLTDMVLDEMAAPGKKEYRSLWKVTPFKLDLPTGAYVEDTAEMDAKVIRAFMDASLFGSTPSKDRNSAGSGSDKRVAHDIDLMDNQADADMITAVYEHVAEVNGWNDKYGDGKPLRFWFKSFHTATADTSTGKLYQKDPNATPPPKA